MATNKQRPTSTSATPFGLPRHDLTRSDWVLLPQSHYPKFVHHWPSIGCLVPSAPHPNRRDVALNRVSCSLTLWPQRDVCHASNIMWTPNNGSTMLDMANPPIRTYSTHHINRSPPQPIITNVRRPSGALYDHSFNKNQMNQKQYSPPQQHNRNQPRCFMPPNNAGATFYNQGYPTSGFNGPNGGTGFYANVHQHQTQPHHQMAFQGKQKRWGSPNVPQKRHLAGSPPRASDAFPLAQTLGEFDFW